MEKSRIRTIIESLPNGVLVTNPNGQVVLMNPAFQRDSRPFPPYSLHNASNCYVSEEELCRLVIDHFKGSTLILKISPPTNFPTGPDQYLVARGQPVLRENKECWGRWVTFMDITRHEGAGSAEDPSLWPKVPMNSDRRCPPIHEQLGVVLRDAMEEESQRDQVFAAPEHRKKPRA